MAEESGSKQSSDKVKMEIERSRHLLARDVSGLRYELDLPGKIRRSFQGNTTAWVVGAIALGAVMVVLPRMRKKVYIKVGKDGSETTGKLLQGGLLLGALRIGATLLKPAVLGFIRQKMSGEGGFSTRGPRKW